MRNLKNITLEMSLKPFKRVDVKYIENVCTNAFTQWNNLIKHSDMVSVLLWSSDGSEILDYKGDLDEGFEWAKYIGGASSTKKWDRKTDPEGIGLHTRSYLYTEEPVAFTYGLLKQVIRIIGRVGKEITGKPVRVGATFDPGPEFAPSDFKYLRHNEICLGDTYGKKSFVCCYGILHEDKREYAGFPEGIPEGTPFGMFFGRQCRHFLRDMGFDFLWLSNGFGYGCENWGITGALFDGKCFDNEKSEKIKEKILSFWRLFREECPDIRVETRGTNLSTGIDLSTDGVPLQDIYNGGFNVMPPPNSPWAALNGDFGLELAGFMSHIAELPENDYMFRFYVHDPWWMNSPWLDRYGREPYDIYLPLAVSRIDGSGEIRNPSYISFLTIDNSMGEMPDKCPNEVIPHLINALEHAPDAVSPLVWLYPFSDYHQMVSGKSSRSDEVFFGDWFMRGAVNNGFPVSTVVSTDSFALTRYIKPEFYKGCVLVSPVPLMDSVHEQLIIEAIKTGKKVLLYGPLENSSKKLLNLLNLDIRNTITGIMNIKVSLTMDDSGCKTCPEIINHRGILSGGRIGTVLKNRNDINTSIIVTVEKGAKARIYSLYRSELGWNGGSVVWIRGTNSCHYSKGEMLPVSDSPSEYFHAENLMRLALGCFGFDFRFTGKSAQARNPVIMLHRNSNAFYFSGYMPDTTVGIKMRFPLGAPVFLETETEIKDGCSLYHMPRSWHKECRVFAQQKEDGILSCIEYPPVSAVMGRRIRVSGLQDTTLRIFPPKGFEDATEVLLNSFPEHHLIGEPVEWELKDSPWGKYMEVRNVTGNLMISIPFHEKKHYKSPYISNDEIYTERN